MFQCIAVLPQLLSCQLQTAAECCAEAKGLGLDSVALGALVRGSHLRVLVANVVPPLAMPDPVNDLEACRQPHW